MYECSYGIKNLTSMSSWSSFNMEHRSRVNIPRWQVPRRQIDRPGQVYHGFLGNKSEKCQRGRNKYFRWIVLEKHLNTFSWSQTKLMVLVMNSLLLFFWSFIYFPFHFQWEIKVHQGKKSVNILTWSNFLFKGGIMKFKGSEHKNVQRKLLQDIKKKPWKPVDSKFRIWEDSLS